MPFLPPLQATARYYTSLLIVLGEIGHGDMRQAAYGSRQCAGDSQGAAGADVARYRCAVRGKARPRSVVLHGPGCCLRY